MFETPITVVGNIVTRPDRRWVGDQELIKFRLASNSRRRTADGQWEPGNTLFVTVNCWGKLVTGVGAGLGKGDPVIVVGYVHTSEYEDKEGVRRSSVEVRATSVGPDLARCVVRIEHRRHANSGGDANGAGAAAAAPGNGIGTGIATGLANAGNDAGNGNGVDAAATDPVGPDTDADPAGAAGLPLSA